MCEVELTEEDGERRCEGHDVGCLCDQLLSMGRKGERTGHGNVEYGALQVTELSDASQPDGVHVTDRLGESECGDERGEKLKRPWIRRARAKVVVCLYDGDAIERLIGPD